MKGRRKSNNNENPRELKYIYCNWFTKVAQKKNVSNNQKRNKINEQGFNQKCVSYRVLYGWFKKRVFFFLAKNGHRFRFWPNQRKKRAQILGVLTFRERILISQKNFLMICWYKISTILSFVAFKLYSLKKIYVYGQYTRS